MAQIEMNGLVIVFDDIFLELVLARRWAILPSGKTFYARSGRVLMHRMLMNADSGQLVDHINRNGLDKRLANLRFVGRQGNKANSFSQKKTSAFIGVSARTGGRRKPYRVQVKIDGRNKCLGHYETEAEAAHAYDAHASRMYGHLAILNFPVKAE